MHVGIGEHDYPAESNKENQQNSAEHWPRIKGIARNCNAGGNEKTNAAQHDSTNPPEQILGKTQIRQANQFFRVADEFVRGRCWSLPPVIRASVARVDLDERVLFQS